MFFPKIIYSLSHKILNFTEINRGVEHGLWDTFETLKETILNYKSCWKQRGVMAFSLAKLVFLLSLCSFIFASLAQNGDPIQRICSKSRNPNFCYEFYKYNHNDTLQDLALKAVNNARFVSYGIYKLLINIVKQTTDPKLKGKYESCWRNYVAAYSTLQLASKSLNDPKGLNGKLFDAQYAIADCNKGLGGIPGIGGRPVNPPELHAGNEKTSNLCSIAIVITNLL